MDSWFGDYAWISKLLRRATVFTWQPRELSLFRGIWPSEQFTYEKKKCQCFWVHREINVRFRGKTQWNMFPLVSGRHVGAHLEGHQHGVSIQISNLVPRVSLLCLPWSLEERPWLWLSMWPNRIWVAKKICWIGGWQNVLFVDVANFVGFKSWSSSSR